MTTRLLTEDQQRRYARDGVTFPIPVLSLQETAAFRAICDELETHLGGKPRTIDVRQMHLHFRWAYDLATRPRVLDAVEDLLGPNLLVWATELFAKHPHDAAVKIGWHRDQPYMGFDPELTTTAWVALSDSTPSNGCMKAVIEPDRVRAAASVLPTGGASASPETPAGAGADGKLIDVVLRQGEMSLHDPHVLHGSGPNLSSGKRVGFVIRFVAPQAQPLHGQPPAVLARGVDRYQNFRLVEPPREMALEEALSGLKLSATDHLETMLNNLKHQRA